MYYDQDNGYFRLKAYGRPEDHLWYYAGDGLSNDHWEFISEHACTPGDPKRWEDAGNEGDIYYNDLNDSYYIYRQFGRPSDHDWFFPTGDRSNHYWLFSGVHSGTSEDPKSVDEYGTVGSVYKHDVKYYTVKKRGSPGDHHRLFERGSNVNDYCELGSYKENNGTFLRSKSIDMPGDVGYVYFSQEQQRYFVLKQAGATTEPGWAFPTDGKDNDKWFNSGRNQGTFLQPKTFQEYGKLGFIYFDETK